ncbi:hypothetical protein TWF970_005448 [Orbilia oligospora]|uniref:Clr5 domain-containing protein n=1 Tax=Orbilia oligospora TaxID=2813651 RepID=A0A7C8VF40_ORBOL|nr:hypothetical protein TWF970_005448 [Orbilia oligospora]
MPQSVLEGRIVKRGQTSRKQSQAATQLTTRPKAEKNGRAKQNKELASHKHKEAIKYYYLTRRYTLQKLHEAMEIIFKVGATSKQYSGYVDKCNFRKKLTKEEWESVAAYCYKSHALGQEVAIKLNGQYILEPQTVRKELPRNISLGVQNKIRRQEIAIPPISQWPLRVGQLEVCIPTVNTTIQRMPQSVWRRLPAWESQKPLLQICQKTCQRFGQTEMGIGRLANSNYFKYLRTLLYRLSNSLIKFDVLYRLLDKVESLGFRSSLKELLSFKTNTVRVAAENILPLLIFRCDEDLIEHIFGIHGVLQPPANCYEAILQLLEPGLYMIVRSNCFKSSHVPDGFSGWPGLEDLVDFSHHQAGKALVTFLQSQQIVPSTLSEAAILVACVIDWGLISITTMKQMLPSCFDWGDVEAEYETMFERCIARFKNTIPIQDVLSYGFRRNMYMNALIAVLVNNCKIASDILPFTEINVPTIPCMGKCDKIYNSCNDDCLAETLGLEVFSRLVSATAKEQYNQNRDWNPDSLRYWEVGLLSCSLTVACGMNYQRLYTFILKYLQSCHFGSLPSYSAHESSSEESVDDYGDYPGDDPEYRTGFQIRLRDIEIVNILTGALVEIIDMGRQEIDPWYESFREHFRDFVGRETDLSHKERLEQCQKIVESGAKIGDDTQVSFKNSNSSYEKSTILNYAIAFLDVDLVKVLLKFGADPNLKDYKGRTPIMMLLIILALKSGAGVEDKWHWIYRKKEFGEILHYLLTAGARYPTKNTHITWNWSTYKRGQSAWKEYFTFHDLETRLRPEFMTALRIGDIDQISSLWDGEFERLEPTKPEPCGSCEHLINIFDQAFGETGWWRSFSFITKLCWNTWDPGSRSYLTLDQVVLGFQKKRTQFRTEGSILCILRYSGRLSVMRYLLMLGDEVELFKKFILHHPIDAKAEISTSFPGEMTLLELAAKNERAKCLLLLLQNGCNPNEEVGARGPCSISALNYAVETGHLEIGKSLLEYGADIYRIPGTHDPKHFQTPVEFAVELRRLDFIALFLLHSIECRDIALAAAKKYGHKTIAKWIKDEWMPKPLDPTNSLRSPSTYDIEDYIHEWCYE